MNIYQENGYESRKDYLDTLADDFCVDTDVVYAMADLLGPDEDFDGLYIAVSDAAEAMDQQ